MTLWKGLRTVLKFNLGIRPKNAKQHINENLKVISNNLNLTISDFKNGYKVPKVYGSPFMIAINNLTKQAENIKDTKKDKFEMFLQEILSFVQREKTLKSDILFYQKNSTKAP